jgi:hypothetical protein
VLLTVSVSLSAAALLAMGILLFGDFGETEGRILGTTAFIAGYGLLALPAGILFDQRRHQALAALVVGLASSGLVLALAGIWTTDAPEALAKAMVTVTVAAVAGTQTAALAARAGPHDPRLVRRLFRFSVALALLLASLVAAAIWLEVGNQVFLRIVGALAVLDVLMVVLQPVLALLKPSGDRHRLLVQVEGREPIEMAVEATDLATAAAKAIRAAEREGLRVRGVERLERDRAPRPAARDAA